MLIGCEDHILRYVNNARWDSNLLVVCLVESHQQPEYSSQGKEKQKNQKFPVHRTEQEIPDSFGYVPNVNHPLMLNLISALVCLPCL